MKMTKNLINLIVMLFDDAFVCRLTSVYATDQINVIQTTNIAEIARILAYFSSSPIEVILLPHYVFSPITKDADMLDIA